MTMENYSPSHPTDDMDIDDSDEILPKECSDIVILKEALPKEIAILDSKPLVTSFEGDIKESDDIESSAWFKEIRTIESISSDTVNKSQLVKSPQPVKRSRSKSAEKRSISKTTSKRSRSRSGNKRSRSRNRRSRSKSANRRRRSRSGARRSGSRSHSRNRRSRSKNRTNQNDSRNRNSRSYGRDKDNKRPKSRSKSPLDRNQVSDKEFKKRETIRKSKSPQSRPNQDRNENNIFNKLIDMQALPTSNSPKQKWSYDSDEEGSTTVVKPVQSTFPDNRGRSGNFGERSFRDRQDFGDRRGRSFQRGGPWGQDRPNFRNENYEQRDSRNQQWSQPRQDHGTDRNIPQRNENNKERDLTPVVKNAWGSDEESSNWGKKNDVHTKATIDEPSINSVNKIDTEAKANKFAADSDEEFGNWGKEMKNDCDSPVAAQMRVTEPSHVRGNENKSQVRAPPSNPNVRDVGDGGFVAWKNAQKNDIPKSPPTDKFADNSDDEFGAWGKETKSSGGWDANSRAADRTTMKSRDSDEEVGAWGSAQRSTKPNDDFLQDTRCDDSFAADSRGNFHGRGGFNNNQYGPRRGRGGMMPRNYENNRFQRPPSQDRFYNNAPSYPNDNSYGSGNSGVNNSIGGGYNNNYNNAPSPIQPNYNYKPPQMPQWATQAQNMGYPSRPPGPMPFPLDTSVCPPMNMLQPQMHQQPVQMMQSMPFIPPPPPNMSMDNRGQPIGPGSMMNLLGGQGLNITQPAINMNTPSNINQSAMNMNQHSNINQSTMSMSQSGNINQSAMSIAQLSNLMNPSGNTNPGSSNINQLPLASNQLDNNLLETLMTRVGLPSDSLRLDKKFDSSNTINDTLNTMLKTAANTVISRLVESSNQKAVPTISDNMSMSPPSPPSNSPPPALIHARFGNNFTATAKQSAAAAFIPPPLPNYSDVLKQSTNKMTIPIVAKTSSEHPDEEKRNRSDFDSKIDWQERVALEVKVFLKPAYMSRSIDKNDYKEIMKRCVTKITRSGVTEINSDKIEKFVLSYVDKYNKNRKGKQHSTVSSSEHDLRCD